MSMILNPYRYAAAGGNVIVSQEDEANESADQSSYTFSSMGIGTAAGNRDVLVAVMARQNGTNGPLTVTVGGSSTTEIIALSRASGSNYVGLYWLSYPTGTTADVVVTTNSGTMQWIGAATFSILGATAVHDTASGLNTTATATIDIPNNGGLIGGGASHWRPDEYGWSGWTGLENVTETDFVNDGYAYGSESEISPSESGRSIYFSTLESAWVAASFE